MLNLSALFLSQKRLNEVLDRQLLPAAVRHVDLSDPRNDGLYRTSILTAYEDAAVNWLNTAELPTLGELIAQDQLRQGAFFTHLGPFLGQGIQDAATLAYLKKPLNREAVLWAKLDGFRDGMTLTVQAHPDNYTSSSAAGEMSGKKRLFLVGRLTECEANDLRAQAYVVGHIHEERRQGLPNIDRFDLLGSRMEAFPTMIDNFAKAGEERQPTKSELERLLTIRESDIKAAFAEIVGEAFVPKDWGGEQSDLVSTQVRLRGESVVTAFAFKGPAKPKKLTVADLGKNGDQISRLFSEPSDFVVLQHCHMVTSAVRDHMRAFATRIGRLRPFCIIDGADTVRVLRAYGKLGFGRKRQRKADR
jgi:hypothetical protein